MNETFSAGRFFRYFLFDNKQLWSRHTRAIVTFGGLGIILYIVTVLLGLLFSQTWHGPSIWARVITLAFASLVLVFYQTKTYGYLTDPKAGAAWLMIPASRLEKFVSMMIITLIEIPVVFLATYLCVDGIIALIDPTVEGAILTNIGSLFSDFNKFVSENSNEISLGITAGGLTFQFWLNVCTNLLFFLLCGICFKKHKIGTGIGILVGLGLLFTMFSGLLVSSGVFMDWAKSTAEGLADAPIERPQRLLNWTLNSEFFLNGLAVLGLGTGIFYRIKSLKH